MTSTSYDYTPDDLVLLSGDKEGNEAAVCSFRKECNNNYKTNIRCKKTNPYRNFEEQTRERGDESCVRALGDELAYFGGISDTKSCDVCQFDFNISDWRAAGNKGENVNPTSTENYTKRPSRNTAAPMQSANFVNDDENGVDHCTEMNLADFDYCGTSIMREVEDCVQTYNGEVFTITDSTERQEMCGSDPNINLTGQCDPCSYAYEGEWERTDDTTVFGPGPEGNVKPAATRRSKAEMDKINVKGKGSNQPTVKNVKKQMAKTKKKNDIKKENYMRYYLKSNYGKNINPHMVDQYKRYFVRNTNQSPPLTPVQVFFIVLACIVVFSLFVKHVVLPSLPKIKSKK